MRNKRIKLIILTFLGLGLTGLQAQETITASGGNAAGSGGTASYTIGQVVYTTSTASNGSIAQGVQQPYEISVVSGINENTDINLSLSAYPNPTTDFLILKVENIDKYNLSYQLFDITGKLLESKKVNGNETTITMVKLTPATYFLRVTDEINEVKTFKIIKN